MLIIGRLARSKLRSCARINCNQVLGRSVIHHYHYIRLLHTAGRHKQHEKNQLPKNDNDVLEADGQTNSKYKFITERDKILAQSDGILTKLRINVRWILRRSTRPFKLSTDDIGAFISWILVSNVIIFLMWTTGLVSMAIYFINTVSAQEFLAKKVGRFLTKQTPTTVVFESAIVPDWSSGKITFNKVFVSRRPHNLHSFDKGSQKEAVERAQLALSEKLLVSDNEFDRGNYTQFDLTIDKVEISLSLPKWLNGRGFLEEVSVSGIRGVVDRTHVVWQTNDDPTNYKNQYTPGDFEISNFHLDDALFTLYQPEGFRPFQVSIFNCDLPQLRKHWLFYDIINAKNISGMYDNSMFTIHRKYKSSKKHANYGNTKLQPGDAREYGDESYVYSLPWERVTRFRVDALNIDHLNTGTGGPLGWISKGRVDMVGDVLLPDTESSQIMELLNVWAEKLLEKSASLGIGSTPNNMTALSKLDPDNIFVMDFFLKLYGVKAEVPLFAPELNYLNAALTRAIVGYINSHRTYIPISCRVVKQISDFEGSWTIYDSMLMQDLSTQVYSAFADYVLDEDQRKIRMRRIAFWSVQAFLQVILLSLGSIA